MQIPQDRGKRAAVLADKHAEYIVGFSKVCIVSCCDLQILRSSISIAQCSHVTFDDQKEVMHAKQRDGHRYIYHSVHKGSKRQLWQVLWH